MNPEGAAMSLSPSSGGQFGQHYQQHYGNSSLAGEYNSYVSHDESYVHEPTPSSSSEPSTSAAPTPTYDDIFPALPETDDLSASVHTAHGYKNVVGNNNSLGVKNRSNATSTSTTSAYSMKIKSSNVTIIHRVPLDNMRSRLGSNKENEHQVKVCKDIMSRTGTNIEFCPSKDSLTFVIHGKEDAVNSAKRLIGSELQTQSEVEIFVKKDHHRFILGKSGKKLSDLQTQTATKISVPKQDSSSELIKIVGVKEGIDKAVHEINVICQELVARASERIHVEKEFHPFINGPYGETVKELMARTGAKINVPPPSVNKTEIHISGETNAVAQAKEAIVALVSDRKKKCTTVHVEVKKSQHRYVIGPKGQTLQEILKKTGVSIEMPPSDNPSETITLRGEQSALGPALSLLCEKAHSEVDDVIDAPAWLQKHIIGPKGAHFQEISQDFTSTVNVSFLAAENKIKIHGPQKDVEKAKEVLEAEVRRVKKEVSVAEIKVDSKYHKFLIGKNGQTINQIRAKTGAQITIPTEEKDGSSQASPGSSGNNPNNKQNHVSHSTDVIRVEGNPSEVDSARKEIEAIIQKRKETDAQVSKELVIEQRFHRQIIGTKGETIKEVRDRFNQVVIAFPESNVKNDKVTVRGPKEDVDNCCKHLAQMHKELLQNNFRLEVPIFKQFHKFLIGKDGANIRKIREETSTKIELPVEGSDSEVIVISGKKKDCELAKQRIQAFEKELVNVVQVDIIIPAKFHNAIIGSKGRLVRSIMEECGGVQIKFPAEGSGSDKVSIRGPKECVAKAKTALVELSNEKQLTGFSVEIKAKPEHHRFLIGKNGSNIKRVRESTGARVIFPTDKDEDRDTIVIIGKKEDALKAKIELETMIRDLEKIVDDSVDIHPKHHGHFVQRKGQVLRQIQDDFGGVTVSFPPRSDKDNHRVVIKGAKDCVSGAKSRLLEEVQRLESLVTIQVEIDQHHHRAIMGARGGNVKAIQAEHNVQIKFPERKQVNGNVNGRGGDTPVNGINSDDAASEVSSITGENKVGKKSNIVILTGPADECEAVKQALVALIPVEETVDVPFDYHRFIIGQKGKDVRDLMEKFDVSISIPPSHEKKDTIKITGCKENALKCKQALLDKVSQLDDDKKERELKSFRIEIHVNPDHHPKIIGKKGATITRIRTKHDVQIQFPERNSKPDADPTLITIIGYETKAMAARDEILDIVKKMEALTTEHVRVDARVHPRLIGSRGRNIRTIMTKFDVDIKFPRQGDADPNIVTISGLPEHVEAAKDHVLTLEEEYLDDEGTEYAPPKLPTNPFSDSRSSGFVVKDAPWHAPDTSNKEEFPSFGGIPAAPSTDAVPTLATSSDGSSEKNGHSAWRR